jgi:hypothetical protein
MWILKFLPDWIFYLILLVGILGIAASFILKFIPFVSLYRLPIQAASVLLIVIGVWFAGAMSVEAEWQKKVAELTVKIAKAEAESAEANTKLQVTISQQEMLIQDQQSQLKQRVRIAAAEMNKECKIPQNAISIINEAARKGTK